MALAQGQRGKFSSATLSAIQSTILAAASAIALSACGGGDGGGFQPPPAEVNVAEVVRKNVRTWDEFTGRVVASEVVEIRPRVAGYLRDIAFEEGGIVRKGQRLFVVDTRPFEAQVARARAELARARSAADTARSERARADRLIAAKAISREEYEQRIGGDRGAVAGVQAAEAALNAAQLDLDYALIESPIDGRIGASALREGNLVEAGTLLTTVVALDPMFVYFDSDERAYLKYGAATDGARRSVRVAVGDEDDFPHEGRLDFVDNQIDPNTATIRARAVLDNADGKLMPGLFARVRLIDGAEREALLIHDAAVMTDQDRKYVYAVSPDGKAIRKDVTLGGKVDGLRIVTGGLAPGDRIVVNGVRKIFFPGMPVKPLPVPMDKPDTPPPAPKGAAAGG
ncbi:MAG: efflux RND transporter periplasmic adaptor subunit [Lysobacter sp.]|nr:efflux RND transporter periplasmic adaptor subunit [Lysobacter sp.]